MLEGQWWKTLCTREETRFIRYKPVIVGFRTTSYTFPDNWTAVARDLTVFYDSNRSIGASSLRRAMALPFIIPLGSARATWSRSSTRDKFQVNRQQPFSFLLFFLFSLSLSPFFLRAYRLWKLNWSFKVMSINLDKLIVPNCSWLWCIVAIIVFFAIIRIHNYANICTK